MSVNRAGGMLEFNGQGCVVSFRNIHFDSCPVYARKGAVVLCDECTFTGFPSDKFVHILHSTGWRSVLKARAL